MQDDKKTFNFAIATDCEYDWDFIQLLERASHERGLSTYVVLPNNLKETVEKLHSGQLQFNFLYDRASDTSPKFLELHNLMLQNNIPTLDALESLQRASDKATMHLEFIANGLLTPYTIILPPYNTTESIYLSVADLAKLGRPFIIKPANTTGGGIGVVDGAETLQDVLQARQEYQADKYLLQEKVAPLEENGKRFWFRGFYVCGLVECAWWHDLNHVYEILTAEELEQFELHSLFSIVREIAQICKLHFFSTEIVLNLERKFVVIDYVNEICDMRLKSLHFDGVPDMIVQKVANQIVSHIEKRITKNE